MLTHVDRTIADRSVTRIRASHGLQGAFALSPPAAGRHARRLAALPEMVLYDCAARRRHLDEIDVLDEKTRAGPTLAVQKNDQERVRVPRRSRVTSPCRRSLHDRSSEVQSASSLRSHSAMLKSML